jgi:tRNA 2-thiouridine synthesizing protein A
MAKTTRPKAQVTLDMKGAACPGPMLGARRVLDDLLAGEVLRLISDCPATKDDLYSWPKYADIEILKTEKLPRGGTAYYIRKGKTRDIAPDAVLDMRGATCPGPVIEAKRRLNGLRKGEVLQLVSDCPGIRADVRSWVKATGLELADTRESAPGEYMFHIRKR